MGEEPGMDAILYESLKKQLLKSCTAEQLLDLERDTQVTLAKRYSEAAIAARSLKITACPHCGAKETLVRHGRDALGRQRFLCRKKDGGCGRTFNALSGTAFARMRKPELWASFVGHFSTGLSLSKIAATGIGICRHTAFRWRHRLLKALAPAAPDRMSGVAETDEKFFLRSFKGHRGWKRGQPPEPRPPRYRGSGALLPGLSWQQVPILTCIDRNNRHLDEVLEKRTKAEVLTKLEKLIEPGTVLCSDDFPGYAALAEKVHAEHRIIEQSKDTWLKKAIGHKPRQKGALGLGRVNSHHQAMETLINRVLRGVSTKYLPGYLTMLRIQRRRPANPALGIGAAMLAPCG
jgi:transposase-like protein